MGQKMEDAASSGSFASLPGGNLYVKEIQDLRYLDWANKKYSVGTPGCFLKAYEEKQGDRIYYKMSNYDSYRGIFGHECINEWIVAKLLDILEIPHLEYPLIFARLCVDGREMEGYVTKSFNFRKRNEKKCLLTRITN